MSSTVQKTKVKLTAATEPTDHNPRPRPETAGNSTNFQRLQSQIVISLGKFPMSAGALGVRGAARLLRGRTSVSARPGAHGEKVGGGTT